MNAPVVQRMNVAEFLAWSERQPDDRHELVDGRVVGTTRDTVRHNLTKFAAAQALNEAIRAAAAPCVVFIDGVGVQISEKTLRIPDVMVQCGAAPDLDAMIVERPLIIVEVVSPSSEHDDFEGKFVEYFSVASLQHYLIIHSEKRAVVHHQRDEHGTINSRIAHDGDIALDPPGITVPVAALLGPTPPATN